MSFPRYPKYKDSSVEWLGQVPEHWDVKRLRFVMESNPSKSEIANLDRETIVSFLPMEDISEDGKLNLDRKKTIGELESGYTYFRDGDVAIAKITPCYENGKGALMRGLVNGIGFGTTELIVARPKRDKITGSYLHYIFKSPDFRDIGASHMYGAGGQKRVPDVFVRNFITALPPLPEQTLIATFLDGEMIKIDELVAEQQRLMGLLKEKCQSVIYHAVTQGLNANVPMKPSGLVWPAQVPNHWEVLPLARVVQQFIDYRGVTPEKLDEGTIPLITATQIKNGRIDHALDPVFISEEEYATRMTRGFPKKGDVLITTEAPLGETAQIKDERVSPGQRIILMKVNPTKVTNAYLYTHFRSQFGRNELWIRASGSTASGIRADRLRASMVLVPPLDEQEAIVRHIDDQISQLPLVEAECRKQIALLQERRTALISSAVTGQIDVRHLTEDPAL